MNMLCINAVHARLCITHRLKRPDPTQRGVDDPVLLHLARGGFPAHIQSVGRWVVDLDIPGWDSWNCETGRERVERETAKQQSENKEFTEQQRKSNSSQRRLNRRKLSKVQE